MHMHDTGDATRFEGKAPSILPSWQHDRPADVENFSAETKKRAAPASSWNFGSLKKVGVEGRGRSELHDRLEIATN